jgi:hypothetical protein
MIDIIQVGNSARFKAQFYDFDNNPVDADSVVFSVYNAANTSTKVSETALGAGNRSGVGAYWHVFTPAAAGVYQVEFTGLINGVPALVRKTVKAQWV